MPIGYKTLSIKEEVFGRAQKLYKQKKTQLNFSPWVSEYLLMAIEKDEFLKDYAPYLSYVGESDNVMFIKDEKKGRVPEVSLKNNKLHCNLDGPDCEHIHYVLALTDLGKIIANASKVKG